MSKQLYLYRVLENDDDGDPLDHGVLRADDPDAAIRHVRDRMKQIGLFDEHPVVRFYPLQDAVDGVLQDADEDMFTRTV